MKVSIVYIQWADAHGNTGWFNAEESAKWAEQEWYCDDVGYLIKETPKMIVIAQRHEPFGHANGTEQWGGLHKIPKTWIRNRRLLGYLNHDGSIISPPIPAAHRRKR